MSGVGPTVWLRERPDVLRRLDHSVAASPEQAVSMVDSVLRSAGVDVAMARSPGEYAWAVDLETVSLDASLEKSDDGAWSLVVASPLSEIDQVEPFPPGFWRRLMELNHLTTRSARFCLVDQALSVEAQHPLLGLSEKEIALTLDVVASCARLWLERVSDELSEAITTAPLSLDDMPPVPMLPKDMEQARVLLGRSGTHGVLFFGDLMAGWSRLGYLVSACAGDIWLEFAATGESVTVASLKVPRRKSPQLVLHTDALEKCGVFPSEALNAFRRAVTGSVKVRASGGALVVAANQNRGPDQADALISAMAELAAAARKN